MALDICFEQLDLAPRRNSRSSSPIYESEDDTSSTNSDHINYQPRRELEDDRISTNSDHINHQPHVEPEASNEPIISPKGKIFYQSLPYKLP